MSTTELHHVHYRTQLTCYLGKLRITSDYEHFVRELNMFDRNDIAGVITFIPRCMTLEGSGRVLNSSSRTIDYAV